MHNFLIILISSFTGSSVSPILPSEFPTDQPIFLRRLYCNLQLQPLLSSKQILEKDNKSKIIKAGKRKRNIKREMGKKRKEERREEKR